MTADREAPTTEGQGSTGGARDARGLDAILADVIPALAARLRASGLAELEVRTADWRVRVRREPGTAQALAPEPATAAHGPQARGAGAARSGAADDAGMARSPAVGYFLPSQAAEVGRSVRSGDLLGHIEMLGIHHDVAAPVDGVVIRALAESGQAVEYGQALVLVQAGGSLALAGPSRPDLVSD